MCTYISTGTTGKMANSGMPGVYPATPGDDPTVVLATQGWFESLFGLGFDSATPANRNMSFLPKVKWLRYPNRSAPAGSVMGSYLLTILTKAQ